jgi:hypothetical protein
MNHAAGRGPLVTLALALGCGSTPGTPHVTPPAAKATAVAPAEAASPPIPTMHKPRGIVESPHGGSIVQLAVTPDGKAAVSADELGGIRVWLALDGTIEPRVIDLPAPKTLAIGRLAGGLVAVSLDEVGGLYLAKLDTDGRVVSHVTLGVDPPFAGLVMTELGLLAWRSDHTVLLLDAGGATLGKLAAEPGQRVVGIAVAGKRALALLERGDKRGLRWLAFEGELGWGAWVDTDGELAGVTDLALSPSAKRVALVTRVDRVTQTHAFELAEGKSLGGSTLISGAADVGFLDETTIAVGSLEGIAWLDLNAPKAALSAALHATTTAVRRGAILGIGGGRAITAQNGELVLATPTATQFLGYELPAPRLFQAAPNGQVLVGVDETFSLLDKDLRAAGSIPLALAAGSRVSQLRWLDGDEWLVETVKPGTSSLQLALLDLGKRTSTIVRSDLKESHIVMYEPSTQLATLSFGSASEVAHFDRATRKLDRIASLAKASAYEQVLLVPVAPKLARGTQLLHITMTDRPTIRWIRDPRAIDKPTAAVTVDGSYAGADAAGHAFVWRTTPAGKLELAVYLDGRPLHALPTDGPVLLWPDPDGARVVATGASSVALYQVDGKQLWARELAATQEALWLTDGAIAITSAGGIARIDPSTGSVIAARCGWRFALSSKPHPPTPRIESLCSQLER